MSIYASARQKSYTIQPGQGIDDTIDGWAANSVVVDNYSHQYFYIPNAPKFVDPGVHHVIIPLPNVSRLQGQFQAPPGITQPPSVANDNVLLTFYESEFMPSQGIASDISRTLLTRVPIGSNSTTFVPINIQPGIKGLGFITSATGNNNRCQISNITGFQTVATYYDSTGNNTQYFVNGFTVVPIIVPTPLIDTQLDIEVISTSLTTFNLWIFQINDIEQFTGNNSTVDIVSNSSRQLGIVTANGPQPYDLSPSMGEIAAGQQGTCTAPAVPGHRWVCRALHAELTAIAAPGANAVRVHLLDGPSGSANIIQSWAMGIPAVAGFSTIINLAGLSFVGSVNTAMTWEFSSLIAGVFESGGIGLQQL